MKKLDKDVVNYNNNHKDKLKELRKRLKKRRKLIKPKPPRYDDIYYAGVRWLDWLAISEDKVVCVHFQNLDRGIECMAINCPCDLYESECREL